MIDNAPYPMVDDKNQLVTKSCTSGPFILVYLSHENPIIFGVEKCFQYLPAGDFFNSHVGF